MNGAAGILKQYNHETYSHVCCAAGTGTTTAGLYQQSYPHQQCIAVSALKNHNGLEADIRSLSGPLVKSLAVIHEFHFGGYAKYTPALLSFMNRFYEQYRIPTDIVYTGKLFFAVNALAERNFFPANSHLLVIHSGGLTGNLSLKKGTLIF
jgi:1-aminocyclopropane-1-carboxylate deaminase